MTKKLLLLFLIIVSPAVFAQETERTKVSGKIYVPTDGDPEGISVYNVSSQKGTITNADGTFEIEIAENDRLQISALQYQSFTVVIDKGIVEQKHMNIFMNPNINQLEEVVVRPYDLSGNIRVDVKEIPTYSITKDWDLSYANLEYGYVFEPDAQTKISGNAAEEALNSNALKNGANILALLGGVAQLLFPEGKEISIVAKKENLASVGNNLQQRFSKDFVVSTFGIPKEQAVDFLFFAQENGLEKHLLKPENEMELIEFLLKKSNEYKQRGQVEVNEK